MKSRPERVPAELLDVELSPPFFINLLACSPCEEGDVISLEEGAKHFKNISIKLVHLILLMELDTLPKDGRTPIISGP